MTRCRSPAEFEAASTVSGPKLSGIYCQKMERSAMLTKPHDDESHKIYLFRHIRETSVAVRKAVYFVPHLITKLGQLSGCRSRFWLFTALSALTISRKKNLNACTILFHIP